MTVWYHVRDLETARAFYRDKLGFEERYFDAEARWSRLVRDGMEIALAEGEPTDDGGIAHVDVDDIRAETDRLRRDGVQVGVILELHGEVRLVDVFDPDGNRIQLAQSLA
jgi:catechol 2,3-dioxygenase-like lactoylglutathione lyase family enzyme